MSIVNKIKFEIGGRPFGKQRPRVNTFTHTAYTPSETIKHEKLIKRTYLMNCKDNIPYDGPVSIDIKAYFAVPKSTSKKKTAELIGQHYPKKPDVDNIQKCVLDALNGIAYVDDNRVVESNCSKFYGEEEKTVVEVLFLDE